ncbi:MAG TPA: hypothetical protein VFP66_11645 [Candidatus Limnocylindrales bacterium]|nr:hypothetical protein [Candidatus Limnocylindrales bacterium]
MNLPISSVSGFLHHPLAAQRLRISARSAYASGTVAAVGVPLLIAMYAVIFRYGPRHPAIERFGIPNDVCVLAQYALAIPVALALHRHNRATAPRLSVTVTTLGIGAMTSIVVLQAMLIAGVIPFEEQVVYVSIAMLILAIWFLVVGRLGRSSGLLSGRTTLVSLLGASYFGYPVWAFWMGRQLASRESLDPGAGDPSGSVPRV